MKIISKAWLWSILIHLTRCKNWPGPSLICLTKYILFKIPDLKNLNFLQPWCLVHLWLSLGWWYLPIVKSTHRIELEWGIHHDYRNTLPVWLGICYSWKNGWPGIFLLTDVSMVCKFFRYGNIKERKYLGKIIKVRGGGWIEKKNHKFQFVNF